MHRRVRFRLQGLLSPIAPVAEAPRANPRCREHTSPEILKLLIPEEHECWLRQDFLENRFKSRYRHAQWSRSCGKRSLGARVVLDQLLYDIWHDHTLATGNPRPATSNLDVYTNEFLALVIDAVVAVNRNL